MKPFLILVALLSLATPALADPYCLGIAKADRFACIAQKYEGYSTCQLINTLDEDVDGDACCNAELTECRVDAYADYLSCRADVDRCTD